MSSEQKVDSFLAGGGIIFADASRFFSFEMTFLLLGGLFDIQYEYEFQPKEEKGQSGLLTATCMVYTVGLTYIFHSRSLGPFFIVELSAVITILPIIHLGPQFLIPR